MDLFHPDLKKDPNFSRICAEFDTAETGESNFEEIRNSEAVISQNQADSGARFSPMQAEASFRKVEQQGHGDRLILSLGGYQFETSRATICMDSDSMLAAWVQRHLPAYRGEPLWIDRDPHRFSHVLNYLRNGTIWLQDVASLRAIQEEAAYFGIAGLEALCEEKIQMIEAREEEKMRKLVFELKSALKEVLGLQRDGITNSTRNRKDVVAILRGRRLGCDDSEEPVFQMDADF